MLYKDFQGEKLSALGLGCMRLPKSGPADSDIDEAATQEMVDYALAHGVNYFDTAWGYHDHASEVVTGRCLAKHPRESYYLATKFPGYDLSNMDKVAEIFPEQLRKTGAGYFDFYLFHNVNEGNIDAYLEHREIHEYLMEQKRAGRIRHLGFSAHGQIPTIKRFLDAYGDDMEFCQLQINWLDWSFQDAREKVALCAEHGLPVWVMEPLRGGTLVAGDAETNLAEQYARKVEAIRPGMGTAEAGLRFIQSIPEVCVTLSGMSTMQQLQQNVATFSEEAPLRADERAALLDVADEMIADGSIPCTACRYCTTECPQGLNIPHIIAAYNQLRAGSSGGFIARMMVNTLPEGQRPEDCIGCGACAAVCPQHIDIPGVMADFAERLAG